MIDMRPFLSGILLLAFAPVLADETSAWLERMNAAMHNLNYRGEFVHVKGEQNQTLAIVHRVEGGAVHERLWSLDGPSREIVRDQKEVKCILADQKTVVVEPRDSASVAGPAFPSLTPELQRFYNFVAHDRSQRIAGRTTRVFDLRPRDPFRFGYRLWLDEETALPLRSDLMAGNGKSIEKLYFIRVSFPATIPAEDLRPRLSAEGYSQYQRPAAEPAGDQSAVPEWIVGDPPRGFRLDRVQRRPGISGRTTVEHQVYTDGLASVSVFVEKLGQGDEAMEGMTDTGDVFGLKYGSHQITVMGDVPERTLRRFGSSVRPIPASQ